MMTLANEAATLLDVLPSSPSSFSWISCVLLAIRKRPPTMRMMSRPEISFPNTANNGAVNRMMIVSEKRSAMRVNMARVRPRVRAFACLFRGNFPARMEMKMILSKPRTISNAVSVIRAIHAWGVADPVQCQSPLI